MVSKTKSKRKKSRKKILIEVKDSLKAFAERLTVDDLITVGLGYWAWKANNDWRAFPLGAVGYRLARSANIAAGGTGLIMLGFTGLIPLTNALKDALGGAVPSDCVMPDGRINLDCVIGKWWEGVTGGSKPSDEEGKGSVG
jgi:hypothetical protein